MPVSMIAGTVQHHLVHLSRQIFIRPWLNAATYVFGQGGSLMDFQQVERQVFRTQGERFVEISLPPLKRLARQAGNQIEADVIEPRVS